MRREEGEEDLHLFQWIALSEVSLDDRFLLCDKTGIRIHPPFSLSVQLCTARGVNVEERLDVCRGKLRINWCVQVDDREKIG